MGHCVLYNSECGIKVGAERLSVASKRSGDISNFRQAIYRISDSEYVARAERAPILAGKENATKTSNSFLLQTAAIAALGSPQYCTNIVGCGGEEGLQRQGSASERSEPPTLAGAEKTVEMSAPQANKRSEASLLFYPGESGEGGRDECSASECGRSVLLVRDCLRAMR